MQQPKIYFKLHWDLVQISAHCSIFFFLGIHVCVLRDTYIEFSSIFRYTTNYISFTHAQMHGCPQPNTGKRNLCKYSIGKVRNEIACEPILNKVWLMKLKCSALSVDRKSSRRCRMRKGGKRQGGGRVRAKEKGEVFFFWFASFVFQQNHRWHHMNGCFELIFRLIIVYNIYQMLSFMSL